MPDWEGHHMGGGELSSWQKWMMSQKHPQQNISNEDVIEQFPTKKYPKLNVNTKNVCQAENGLLML